MYSFIPEEELFKNPSLIKKQFYRQEFSDKLIKYSLDSKIIKYNEMIKVQILSEELLEEYESKWDWNIVEQYQSYSDYFYNKWKHKFSQE